MTTPRVEQNENTMEAPDLPKLEYMIWSNIHVATMNVFVK